MINKTLVVDEDTRYLRRESIRTFMDYLTNKYGKEAQSRLAVKANYLMNLDIEAVKEEINTTSLRIAELEKEWGISNGITLNIARLMTANGYKDRQDFYLLLKSGNKERIMKVPSKSVDDDKMYSLPLRVLVDYRTFSFYLTTLNTYKSKYDDRTSRGNNTIMVSSYGIHPKLDKNLKDTYEVSILAFFENTDTGYLYKKRMLSYLDTLTTNNSFITTQISFSAISLDYTFYVRSEDLDLVKNYLIERDSLIDCTKESDIAEAPFIVSLGITESHTQETTDVVLYTNNCGVSYF